MFVAPALLCSYVSMYLCVCVCVCLCVHFDVDVDVFRVYVCRNVCVSD